MGKIIKNKTFNRRAFTAIVIFLSGLSLPLSGLMNHQMQYEPLSNQRHFWMAMHNSAAILFIIFVIVHIWYNWRTLIVYARKAKALSVSKELLAAFILVLILVGLFSLHALHAE